MPDHARQRILLTWLACASCMNSLAAAEAESGAGQEQPYRVTRWTTDQGLPQNRISCLKQTRDGYLWIGTWFGLARFDGVRFTVFDKFNTPELVNDAINAVAEGTDGTLWIATPDGLVSYRDHHFHRLTAEDGLPDQRVWRLAACRSGGVWLQADDFVARLAGGKFSQVRQVPISANDTIHGLSEGADGSLHIITAYAWLTLSPRVTELRTNQVENSSGSAWLTGLPAKQPGTLWVGTQQGLQRWDQSVSKTIAAYKFGQRRVDFIYEDRSSNLWVNAKPGELYRCEDSRWMAVDLGDRAAPTSTTCMEEDREGNLWLGTDQGLVQLQTRRAIAYTKKDGLADDHVWSVCEGTAGVIWVGTDHGLSKIRNDRVVSLGVDEPYPNHADRCVWPAREGGVWIGKSGFGVVEFSDQFNIKAATDILPNPNFYTLLEDRSGKLWIGTGNGIGVLKDGHLTALHTNWAGRFGYDVRCILEDRAGTVWFGTQGQGLSRLRDGKFDVFTESNGLSNNRVWAIHEDPDGALWLGTENGLCRYRKEKFFSFTRRHGLLENSVNWILEDDFGHLWLSGLRGIYRVKRAQLDTVAEGRAQSVQVAAFGTADGMESSETNGEGQPAGWKARDGRLWFPTTRGVVVIDPKTIEVSEVPPPVVIEQVQADGEIIFGDGLAADVRRLSSSGAQIPTLNSQPNSQSLLTSAATLRLAPGRARALQIRYTANSFANPRRVRFRYRLAGSDSDWREDTEERVAYYTNLRPGDYKFAVMAANPHGVWNETPAEFAFSLAPHFYETWPFYSLCAVLVIGVAAGVQAYRLRWQHRLLKLEHQRALAEERTRIARDLHDDLGTALTGLALELDVMRRDGQNAPLPERLGETARRTRELAEQMREVVWTVNPKCDTVSSLAGFLEQQTSQFLRAANIEVRLEFPEDIPALPVSADARHQLALAVREALTNIVRHAQATNVVLSVQIAGELVVQIKDNGRGFHSVPQTGHGLDNMRTRLVQIGGSFECLSTPGAGTILTFRLPLRRATVENGGFA